MITTVELNEEQRRVVLSALNLFFRLHMGQYREFLYEVVPNEVDRDDVRQKMIEIHQLVYPELSGLNASYGIRSAQTPEKARVACDIHDAIRSKAAWFQYPKGDKLNVSFDLPQQVGKEPFPKVKCRWEEEQS